jgi:hypothetical protein
MKANAIGTAQQDDATTATAAAARPPALVSCRAFIVLQIARGPGGFKAARGSNRLARAWRPKRGSSGRSPWGHRIGADGVFGLKLRSRPMTNHRYGPISQTMRVLLAFLAVLGLMLSPVTASAAMRQCADQDRAMTAMADAHGSTAMAVMECCPQAKPTSQQGPAKPAPAKHDRNSCANACATICLAVAALPASTPVHTVVPLTAQFAPGLSASLTPHDPPRLERPPRSIA